jgi:hypothetical protein
VDTGALHVTVLDRRPGVGWPIYRIVCAVARDPGAVRVVECQGEPELDELLARLAVPSEACGLALRRLSLNGHATIQALPLSDADLAWLGPRLDAPPAA